MAPKLGIPFLDGVSSAILLSLLLLFQQLLNLITHFSYLIMLFFSLQYFYYYQLTLSLHVNCSDICLARRFLVLRQTQYLLFPSSRISNKFVSHILMNIHLFSLAILLFVVSFIILTDLFLVRLARLLLSWRASELSAFFLKKMGNVPHNQTFLPLRVTNTICSLG